MPRSKKFQFRRGTLAEWDLANAVLADGEPGFVRDTGELRIGNGVTTWTSLVGVGSEAANMRSFSSLEASTAAARVITNSLPRIVAPTAVTTSILWGPVTFPRVFLPHGFNMGVDIVNDSGGAGNIVLRMIVRKFNAFGAVAGPTVALDNSQTRAAPGNGSCETVLPVAWFNVVSAQDLFGSLYTFELQRVGGGADTLAGNLGISHLIVNRGTL